MYMYTLYIRYTHEFHVSFIACFGVHNVLALLASIPVHMSAERNLQVDRALNQEKAGTNQDEVHMTPNLSGSMSHDLWRKKAIFRSSTGTQIHIKLQDSCERVPTLVHLHVYMYMYMYVSLWSCVCTCVGGWG